MVDTWAIIYRDKLVLLCTMDLISIFYLVNNLDNVKIRDKIELAEKYETKLTYWNKIKT